MIVSSQLMALNEHCPNYDANSNLQRYVKVSKNCELNRRKGFVGHEINDRLVMF